MCDFVLFLLLRVGFFLELFRRNWCNKDLVCSWCSDLRAPGLTLLFPPPPPPPHPWAPHAPGPLAWHTHSSRGPGAQPLRGPADTCVGPQPRPPAGLPAFLSTREGKPLADSLWQKLQLITSLNKQKAARVSAAWGCGNVQSQTSKGPQRSSSSDLSGFLLTASRPGGSLPKEGAGAFFRQSGSQG